MGTYTFVPFGFFQIFPLFYPYGHFHIFPIWVPPGFPNMGPILVFTFISHLCLPRFYPLDTHMGIHICFQFGFPRLFPYFTHMGIFIYFPFGVPQVYPIWDLYWYSHLFPICFCPGFTHKIPIWDGPSNFPYGLPNMGPTRDTYGICMGSPLPRWPRWPGLFPYGPHMGM